MSDSKVKGNSYFSLNFSDEQGQFTGDDYKVYSTNMRIDHEIKKWLSVGVNMQGSYVYRNKAYSRFINSLVSVPLGTVYNEDGSINVNPNSLTVIKEAYVEPELEKYDKEDSFQFMRTGYFCLDSKDSTKEHMVFNRIVSLKSSYKPN